MATEEKILTPEEMEALKAPEPAAEPVSAQTAEAPPMESVLKKQEELEARDRDILAALDEMLQRKAPQTKRPQPQEESGLEKFCIGVVRKGAGILSLSLILIFMGVVILTCFFSDAPDYLLPLKLSPVAAILIGIELLVYNLISGRKFRIHIPAICISAVIIAGCCTMAVVLNSSYTESREEYDNRSIAAQIYEKGYYELRHAADIAEIDVKVELNPDGNARKSGIESLSADDNVEITVEFAGAYKDPDDFAAECKTVIDGYRFLGIHVTKFRFISEGRLSSYRLDVDGMFMQDWSESDLAAEVNYVYLEDMDYIEDLTDVTEEVPETIETTER